MSDRKLFDARETLMSEVSSSPARWCTASLVTAIRAIVTWSPATQDLPSPLAAVVASPGTLIQAFRAATAELTSRGLDADSLVRYGMRNEIASSLLGMLLVRSLGFDMPELEHRRGLDIDSWRAVLPGRFDADPATEVTSDHVLQRAAEVARSQLPLILYWITQAPPDALVSLPAPDREDLREAMPPDSAELGLCEQYAWLVDRFSTTSLRDWLTTSLHREFQWQAGQEPPPCRAESMDDREVHKPDLNAEIARRAVLGTPDGHPDPEMVLAADMTLHALSLLRQGRCREAAALFEFAARRRPTDPVSRNNLGFCLIPRDPRRAMHDLEAAAQMGYGPAVVNVYNRVCCHLALHQSKAALTLADSYWANRDVDEDGGATLWFWHGDAEWKIGGSEDPHLTLAELAGGIAQAEGWREDEERWRLRAESRKRD